MATDSQFKVGNLVVYARFGEYRQGKVTEVRIEPPFPGALEIEDSGDGKRQWRDPWLHEVRRV